MYSHIEVNNGNIKASTSVCRDRGGRTKGLRNAYFATGIISGRLLSIADCWGSAEAETIFNANLGIDGGRQSKEEYGSGEGLGEHLDKQ